VGTGKTVTATGLSLSGSSAGNYTVNTSATTTADITARALTVKAAGVNKTYDGTSTATVTLSDNRLTGDVFTDSYTSATFANKNVGTGKAVSVSGISLSGTDAGNYALQNTTASTTASITKATLTITATANTKYYDGTTSAAAVPSVAGLQTGDSVTNLSETYDNPNVGTGKTLSVATYTVNDGNSGRNYAVTTVTNTNGVINTVKQNQLVAGGPATGTPSPEVLTVAEAEPLVTEAIDLWQAAGADTASVAALKTVTIQVQDIPGDGLGWAIPGLITLDTNAAGYGWFIDPTPADNSKFAPGAANPAQGHVDLLTVVAHELGHELGLGDDTGNDLMGEYLPVGVRRTPDPSLLRVVAAPAPAPTVVTVPAAQLIAARSVGAPAGPVVTQSTVVPQLTSAETIPAVRASHSRRHRQGQQAVQVHQAASHAGRVIHQADTNRHGQSLDGSPLHDLALEQVLAQAKGHRPGRRPRA
jgi:YDG domain